MEVRQGAGIRSRFIENGWIFSCRVASKLIYIVRLFVAFTACGIHGN